MKMWLETQNGNPNACGLPNNNHTIPADIREAKMSDRLSFGVITMCVLPVGLSPGRTPYKGMILNHEALEVDIGETPSLLLGCRHAPSMTDRPNSAEHEWAIQSRIPFQEFVVILFQYHLSLAIGKMFASRAFRPAQQLSCVSE